MYDVGFSETFTEFFSETFERLVSIAFARLDFNRHNLEILPLRRIHPLCRTSGATILALHERAIRLFPNEPFCSMHFLLQKAHALFQQFLRRQRIFDADVVVCRDPHRRAQPTERPLYIG